MSQFISDFNASCATYNFKIDVTDKRQSYYWLLKFTQEAHSVLEIGCATGFFSRHLVEQGCQITGIEINPIAAQEARKYCRKVIVGDVEQTETREHLTERFDAVVLGDVLEHLKSPQDLLVHIQQHWLNPGGIVALSVPNSGHWIFRREVLHGRFPYRQYGLFDRTHLRFFTHTSLYELVTNTGYRIEAESFTVNRNFGNDITFTWFAPLYRRRLDFLSLMIKVEENLAKIFPGLFIYQFVWEIRPD